MTAAIWAALEATWPAAETARVGPWLLRRGLGGGKRVSAASAAGQWLPDHISLAETAMKAWGQTSLFVLRGPEDPLDAVLGDRGYRLVDPVAIYAGDAGRLAEPAPEPLTSFAHWPGLRVTDVIWDAAGIGLARRAVMARVAGPKAVLLGRHGDRVAGVAFVSALGNVAMIHALEVAPDQRRRGVGRNLMRAAGVWAQAQGAATLALAVTDANLPARALYASLGMRAVEHYHYRAKDIDAGKHAR
ncbi:MAG: GNAT family N-acetyltransferase [Pseudomonadota bacterium]